MAKDTDEDSELNYGEYVRKHREAKDITLRKFAERLGITATYQSKVERGELQPPAEDVIRKTATLLEVDFDDLMVRAKRVPSDVTAILKDESQEMVAFLRTASKLDDKQRRELLEQMLKKIKP